MPGARVKRFYSSVKRCPLCVPAIIAEQKHHVGSFRLIVSQYARLFPWKKTIPFPSDSRQIKQIYSLALKNSPFAKKAAAALTLPVSGAALWQLKWNENYSGFRESDGPHLIFFFAPSSLLLDKTYKVMKHSHSTPETSSPILKQTTWRVMAMWRWASLDQPFYALVSACCLLLVVCSVGKVVFNSGHDKSMAMGKLEAK